jgi:hypothetical protein
MIRLGIDDAQEFMDSGRARGRATIGAAVAVYVVDIPEMDPEWAGLNAEELDDIRVVLMSYLHLTRGYGIELTAWGTGRAAAGAQSSAFAMETQGRWIRNPRFSRFWRLVPTCTHGRSRGLVSPLVLCAPSESDR